MDGVVIPIDHRFGWMRRRASPSIVIDWQKEPRGFATLENRPRNRAMITQQAALSNKRKHRTRVYQIQHDGDDMAARIAAQIVDDEVFVGGVRTQAQMSNT